MAGPRVEPFQVALSSLRERLQAGAFAPGARIAAVEVADDLKLSATPVREALSRLAGEGVLEDRRGQGYFVRQLSASDIADLYRLSLAHLLIALDPQRPGRHGRLAAAQDPGPSSPLDAVAHVEALFRQWTLESGSRALVLAFRAVQVQLGPVRRLEPQLLEDLSLEAERLAEAQVADDRDARRGLLRPFHARRIRNADRLAALAEVGVRPIGPGSGQVFP